MVLWQWNSQSLLQNLGYPDTSNPETLLVEGSGNFTDQVQEDFPP
jgi:hypothetical protein